MNNELLNRVVVSNAFARKSKLNLSCIEYKVLLYMISKITFKQSKFLEECIDLKRCAKAFDVSSYNLINDACLSLENLKIGDDKVFEYIEVYDGEIFFRFHDSLADKLLKQKSNMTIFDLGYIYNLKSKYSIRLYLFAMSFRNLHYYNLEETELKRVFQASLPKSEFERRVINRAVQEVNQNTNIYVCCKYYDGRYFFFCREKTKDEKTLFCIDDWRNSREAKSYAVLGKEMFEELEV